MIISEVSGSELLLKTFTCRKKSTPHKTTKGKKKRNQFPVKLLNI
jgi:hypothetical protein